MLGDLTKSFGRDFVLAYFTPGILFITINVVLSLISNFRIESLFSRFNYLEIPNWAALLIITLILALLLFQFNLKLIRLYEGYFKQLFLYFGGFFITVGWLIWLFYLYLVPAPLLSLKTFIFAVVTIGLILILIWVLQSVSECLHRHWHDKFTLEISAIDIKRPEGLMKKYHFVRHYPPKKDNVLPTKLGNILRAFEYHSHTLYGLDPISSWPRLVAVIPKSYQEQIGAAQSTFSFMLNLSFLSTILVFEALGVVLFLVVQNSFKQLFFPVLMILFFLIIAYMFYLLACSYARNWGEYIRGAFDLYRLDLLKRMGVYFPKCPMSLEEEKTIWRLLQRVTFYVENPGDKLKFLPK